MGLVAIERCYSVTRVEPPLRPLPTGALFPPSADVLVYEVSDDTDDALTLHLRVIDGRPVLVGIEAVRLDGGQRELTVEELRGLPLGHLTTSAVRAVGAAVAAAAPAPYGRDPVLEGLAAVAARRRRAMTDDLLSEVARIVNDEANADAPTEAVRRQLFCSYRTAGRWVAEARARGFLPKVERQRKSVEEDQ